ncbi:MAG: hypothetical protein L0216_17850 [Planctomycetales bacterium]|nr:hypothetical protein [Planctomycetales bacterium]
MSPVEIIIYVVVALAVGLAAGRLAARRSRGGALVAILVALVGAIVGGTVARSVGAPEPLAVTVGGRAIPVLWWAIVGATMVTLGVAWLRRSAGRPRPA